MVSQAKPILTEKLKPIDWKEAYEILKHSAEDLCSKVPPVKPKAGEVFVFSATEDSKSSK